MRLVKIDCQKNLYHAYEGNKHLNTIKSDQPLEAEFVEYFRKHTEQVMKELDNDESEGPDAA